MKVNLAAGALSPHLAVAAAFFGLVIFASARDINSFWAFPLGVGAAAAVADILRGRSVLNRQSPSAVHSSGDLAWWLWGELKDLPGDADPSDPPGDLVTRVVCASMDGRLQVAGLIVTTLVVFRASLSMDGNLLLLAAVLAGAAALGRIPARARRAAFLIREHSKLLGRTSALVAVPLLGFGGAVASLPLVTIGLLSAALAFEAIWRDIAHSRASPT